jgi:hypothetical protein
LIVHLPDQPADSVVPAELAEVRNAVRRLEAQLAARHGADTPAYWRAMSQRLDEALVTNRFAPVDGQYRDAASRRAHHWLVRVATAYRSLATPEPGR